MSVAVADGGLETVMVFTEGLDLPAFAAFPLIYDDRGRDALRRYYRSFLEIADEHATAFVLSTPTWRANPEWAAALGYDLAALTKANADAVAFVRGIVGDREGVTVEGVIGPRADGYVVGTQMPDAAAAEYHAHQISVLRGEGVDRVCAVTLNYPGEAIGMVLASRAAGLPAVISFTVETDGRLPDGTALADAIAEVDAATDKGAQFFMINCAHPTHVRHALGNDVTADRVRGLRVNASQLSHAELDAAEELDDGDPAQLGRDHATLRDLLPNIEVLGGCCGTDARHVREIVAAW
ncbi:homocysteine S-methyltransferase family protein [Demequina sp.]|uniref:homocysteine S-methyltransferase family protein n=1 Tax=Demequina sp. TaxID=2050685 RepID=UPI003D0E96E4